MPIAEPRSRAYLAAMSTLVEIQEAITKLRDDEKSALSIWLHSQNAPEMTVEDEQRLLHSLDEAIRDVTPARECPSKTRANW